MTLTFCFRGSSGCSVLLSFMSAPEPSALQWFSLTPHPRNTTPKRLGKSDGEGVSARALTDSSHGRAMEQPAPLSITRREKAREKGEFERGISVPLLEIGFDRFDIGRLHRGVLDLGGLGRALVEELRTHHDSLDQGAE